MRVKDIARLIESIAPVETSMEYDNVGLLVGDENSEVKGVLVALDVTMDAVRRAIEIGANVIVAHHPIIFYPVKKVLASDTAGAIIIEALRNGIAIYAAHTNFDNAKGGITDALMNTLEPFNVSALEEDGTGRIAMIKPRKLGDIVDILRNVTGDDTMRIAGDENRLITKVAIINGAGGRDESLVDRLVGEGVELFVTGETKHSFALALKQRGISLIDIEHYHAERIFNDIMARLIATASVDVSIFNETNPYND